MPTRDSRSDLRVPTHRPRPAHGGAQPSRPFFGPAQGLHGATYVVEATFERPRIDEHGVVIDIGAAGEQLHEVLARLNYRNLDDVPELAGVLTTTERMAQHIGEELCATLDLTGITALEVLLREHPDAWASYRIDLP